MRAVRSCRPSFSVPRAPQRITRNVLSRRPCRSYNTTADEQNKRFNHPKAAALVIGNEVLNGSVNEKNVPVLANLLYKRGVSLERVEIVKDDFDAIAESLGRFSSKVEHVFTSGGIGPTHDDITYEAIARFLKVPLELHQPTVDKMVALSKDRPGWVLNDARKRMAIFPKGAEIITLDGMWTPIVCAGKETKIWILPGIPDLFERMLEGVRVHLPQGHHLARYAVMTKRMEGDLAKALADIQLKHPHLCIGSYPKRGFELVLISVEGNSPDEVRHVADEIKDAVGGYETRPF